MPASDRAPRGFARYRQRAEAAVEQPERVGDVARRAAEKLKKHRGALGSLSRDLPTLVRLARAWARGEYRAVPWKSVVLVVGALLYFISPVDLLPDFLPGLGFLDDAAVVGYVIRAVRSDLRRFQAWENHPSAAAASRRLFRRRPPPAPS